MVRSDLVRALTGEFPAYRGEDIKKIVDIFFNSIIAQISSGGRVELRGFGAFSIRSAGGRMGRNPKSGELVEIKRKNKPYFKAGKKMCDRLNKSRL